MYGGERHRGRDGGETEALSQYAFLFGLVFGLVKRQSQPEYCSNSKVHILPRTVIIPGCDSPRVFYRKCIGADLSVLVRAKYPRMHFNGTVRPIQHRVANLISARSWKVFCEMLSWYSCLRTGYT